MRNLENRTSGLSLLTCEVPRFALVDIDIGDRVEFEGFAADFAFEVVNDEFFVGGVESEAWSQSSGGDWWFWDWGCGCGWY